MRLEMISFHSGLSETYELTEEKKSITYSSSHTIEGWIAKDTVSTTTGVILQADGFPFIVQEQMSDMLINMGLNSGILGLSPESESAGPLFVSALHQQGVIGVNAFSILLGFRADQDSYLTFGGLPEFVTDLDDLVCHRVSGSFLWELKLHSVAVDEHEIRVHDTPLMLMDTGTTLTYLPEADWQRLIDQICQGLAC